MVFCDDGLVELEEEEEVVVVVFVVWLFWQAV